MGIVGLLLLLPAATIALAQDNGVPPGVQLRQEKTTGPEAWTFSTGVSGNYDSNVLFVPGPDPASDISTRLQVALARHWTLRRGTLRLGGDLSHPFYQNESSLSTLMYNFSGGISYSLTRRLVLDASTTLSSSLAQDATVITDTGVVLPAVIVRTGSTAAALTYSLSPRTELSWTLSHTGVGFESTIFRGGSTASTGVSLTRQLNRTHSLGVSGSYQRNFQDGGSANVQTYLGIWQATMGRQWTVFASGGLRPYTIPEEEGYRISPAATVGIRRLIREGQTIGVSYDYTIEQAFGLDRTHLVHTVGGNYEFTWARKYTVSFGGSYAYGIYPLLPDLKLIGELGQVTFAYQVRDDLSLAANVSAFSRAFRPEPAVSSYRAVVSLTYGRSWH
jgi:hypothetical protein